MARFFILRDGTGGVFVGFILFHARYYTDCRKNVCIPIAIFISSFTNIN